MKKTLAIIMFHVVFLAVYFVGFSIIEKQQLIMKPEWWVLAGAVIGMVALTGYVLLLNKLYGGKDENK